jgi:hypothetical protein
MHRCHRLNPVDAGNLMVLETRLSLTPAPVRDMLVKLVLSKCSWQEFAFRHGVSEATVESELKKAIHPFHRENIDEVIDDVTQLVELQFKAGLR